MHRFFLPTECFNDGYVVFPTDITHQLNHVLRLQEGQRLIVLDNIGNEYEVALRPVTGSQRRGTILSTHPAPGEPEVKLALFLCLTQREKFEWMLQKCTEVGAASFTPVVSSRSLVQDTGEDRKKLSRWGKIVREAAEQSGRGFVPEIYPPLAFSAACARAAAQNDLVLIPWEEAHRLQGRRNINEVMTAAGITTGQPLHPLKIALIIGPEGGFSEEEIRTAKDQGAFPVSLGPRILRMETAAVVAATLVLYESGDMGG